MGKIRRLAEREAELRLLHGRGLTRPAIAAAMRVQVARVDKWLARLGLDTAHNRRRAPQACVRCGGPYHRDSLCRRCYGLRQKTYDYATRRARDHGTSRLCPGHERRMAEYEARAAAGLPLFRERNMGRDCYGIKHCAMAVREGVVQIEHCLADQRPGEPDADFLYRRSMLAEKKEALAAWLARLRGEAVGVRLWLESLDTEAEAPPELPSPDGTLETIPVSRWQAAADRFGEPILVLRSQYRPVWNRVEDCTEYAVVEGQATDWEKKNCVERVEPRKEVGGESVPAG